MREIPLNTDTSAADEPSFVGPLNKTIQDLLENISRVVLGKEDVSRLCLVALMAGEHVLLEDVPGVGKTLMGKALAKSVSAEFCRIQFTPDLLPSDIVGSSIFNSRDSQWEQELTQGFISSNYDYLTLIKSIITSKQYRRRL